MIWVLATCGLWLVAAAMALMGSRRFSVPTGWALAAVAIPVLGVVTYQCGPFWGMVALLAAMAVLSGPLRPVLRRARRAVE